MKFALTLLSIAVLLLASCKKNTAVAVKTTPTPTPMPVKQPYVIGYKLLPSELREVYISWPVRTIFSGGVNNDEWLVVTRHGSREEDRNFDPCFTDITSDFRPVIQKDGAKWRIVFETRDVTTEFQP